MIRDGPVPSTVPFGRTVVVHACQSVASITVGSALTFGSAGERSTARCCDEAAYLGWQAWGCVGGVGESA